MTVAYASVDDELFQMLKNEAERRNDVRRLLLDTYFPATQQHYFDVKGKVNTYLSQIEHEMAAEESETYRKKVDLQDEEDVFVRSSIFKNKIPQIYNFTCAVSGFRLETTNDASLVDACHIAPWSEYHDDTITNGITLSPNLHRAFDKGLFTIDEEYRFRIYEHFTESFSPFNLHQFEGKEIHLPKNKSYWPKTDNFKEKLKLLKVGS
jgi:putative restriction endonuclease